MQVIKRNGKQEEVKFDKIIYRIKSLSNGLNVDPPYLAQRAITGLHDNIQTKDIDNFLAETAAVLSAEHPDYAKLAARIAVSSLHKETNSSFYQTSKQLYKAGILSDQYIEKVKKFVDQLEKEIDYERDFNFDYFGYKTLERSYLLKIDGKIIERPQHMFMRVAVEVCDDFVAMSVLYIMLSKGIFTHATPTLFNSGTKRPQLSSCFLLAMQDDSIEGIYDTLKDCALISKNAGGIGLNVHNVRAKGSHIKGTNGFSNGIVPMIKVFNETARYVDQGGGKRKGSFAIYLEPWHADVELFLELKKPTGKEELRARDIFLALWIPDLFMKRVEANADWTLMDPNQQPGLADVYGAEFETLYNKYEQEFPNLKRIKARELMTKIIESQLESGTPYILFKDACNEKSNQKNIGTIKSSNLCCEIVEVSTPDETAVCNLGSICLPKFVRFTEDGKPFFHFDELHLYTSIAVHRLNSVIDKNFYPTEKTRKSNMRHRPIGLGVQGLCDVFFQMKLPYCSKEAKELDERIFATIYHAAIEASAQAAKDNGPYETYDGSPASKGLLQYDLWNKEPHSSLDWKELKEFVAENGLRNSLLTALMPTASTSQIFGNTECFEVVTSNIYKRQTLAGEFVVINKYLISDLEKLDLWSTEMRDKIIGANGSIQNIKEIPDDVRELYKTVWEIPQREVIDHAAIRAPYICQSQSMNLFFNSNVSFGTINSALFYAWKKGLKTGSYYLRTKPVAEAVKVTVKNETKTEEIACSLENPEACIMCQ
jgi:ribonucleoside-diphosphate reductase alpha chain